MIGHFFCKAIVERNTNLCLKGIVLQFMLPQPYNQMRFIKQK